ncbi:MAG: hypothetical protein ACREJ2_03205, partial [Planctomycetota bacterium]
MADAGKSVVHQGGKRGVRSDGKGSVFNADGLCPGCCGCTPAIIATCTVHASDPETNWDLSAFLGNGVGSPGGYWMIIEQVLCLNFSLGSVDANGKLVGLMPTFNAVFLYNTMLYLVVGCV